MSNIIETLLVRNLQEVFGEGDPVRRRAAIEELYAEDCVVLLPIGRYVGHQALDQVAGELRGGHRSFVYTPHSTALANQLFFITNWHNLTGINPQTGERLSKNASEPDGVVMLVPPAIDRL